ncbi:hypothetical protein QUF72_00600 [Desulfobacterales bacterium HSG2]|nr:hypothetical protein [Desulfobacterales bacterium HSG2]MDM8548535.1 hypothetical protein [Desulfobacterales bacterium HSG2]
MTSCPVIPGRIEKMGHFFNSDPESTLLPKRCCHQDFFRKVRNMNLQFATDNCSKSLTCRLTYAILFVLLLVWTYNASAQRFGDVSVACHTLEGETWHGYFEYRLIVTNHSPKAPHQVAVSFSSDRYDRGTYIQTLSRSIAVSPGSTVTASMLQPALPFWGHKGYIHIDGDRQEQSLSVPYSKHISDRYREPLSILISSSLNRDDLLNRPWDKSKSELPPSWYDKRRKRRYSRRKKTQTETQLLPNKDNLNLIHSEQTPDLWSRNWLSYSRYDGIILKNADMEAMPAPVKSAVFSYVKCGGTLTVLGDFHKPASRIQTEQKHHSGAVIYHTGFGQCVVLPVSDIDEITDEQLKYLDEIWRKTQLPWRNIKDSESANKYFPIIESTGINIKGFFIGMLLFVIVVGPVNFIILARKKKKIWLMWTIPAISLFTCASIFAYATLSEGFDSDIRTSGFTILDETSHEAVTLGITAFYCRLTPGAGLHFSNQTELTPMISKYDQAGIPLSIDWTADQHLKSGWITARVPAHFMVRKTEKRRERLELSFTERGNPMVVNGLGAHIKKLWLSDQDGRIYADNNIPAGSRSAPRPTRMKAAPETDTDPFREIYTSFSWKQNPEHLKNWADKHLRPNSYIALLEGCPFIEKGLADPDNLNTDAVVFGIMKNQTNKH